jgi:hypothetical protein
MKALLRVAKFFCGHKNAMNVFEKLIFNLIFLFMRKRFQGRDKFPNGYFRKEPSANRAVQTVKGAEKLAAY